jgi:site-specific DNA-cytosine methylase
MSLLYPRLLAGAARPLYEEYRELAVSDLTRRWDVAHDSAVYVATGGRRVDPDRLRALRAGVVDLARGAGFPAEADRARNAEFDVRLAAHLHSEMGLVPAEAAARDAWAFLSLILLPDVAFWRYPRPPRDRVLGTDITRHVFGRLWWRAQLVHAPDDSAPYEALNILGEAAFDQIYARRTALGGSPELVRAILAVWKTLDFAGLNERNVLRDFLKRLLRLAPFVVFDAVEVCALQEELRAVAEEAITAARHRGGAAAAATLRGELQPELGRTMMAAGPDLEEIPGAPTDAFPSEPPSVASNPVTGSAIGSERPETKRFTFIELCAGSGAQALGLEWAGFDPILLVDSKEDACDTIRRNRPHWPVQLADLVNSSPNTVAFGSPHADLVSAGLPRLTPPKPQVIDDELVVLRAVIDMAEHFAPTAVLLENVPDLVTHPGFAGERRSIEERFAGMGLHCHWHVLNAADFGVPQNRSSGLMVALTEPYTSRFVWPSPDGRAPVTVGRVLGASMSSRGWPGAEQWINKADRVGPALVGGSDKRGGADLGPTGSKRAWDALGVNGNSIADELPGTTTPRDEHPKLTLQQAALLQGIPESWQFSGRKTSTYRQIGHAMPPPVAAAVGRAIARALGV